MMRKDYVLIAKAIKQSWPMSTSHSPMATARRAQHANTVKHVVKALASDNPKFDQTKFEEACGLYAYNQGG